MISAGEAEARVVKGAALMDAMNPGWFHVIDVGMLTLSHWCLCVLGQVYGAYHSGADRLGFTTKRTMDLRGLEEHGFYSDTVQEEIRRVEYALLQDAWIAAIADRRLSQRENERVTDATPTNALDPVDGVVTDCPFA